MHSVRIRLSDMLFPRVTHSGGFFALCNGVLSCVQNCHCCARGVSRFQGAPKNYCEEPTLSVIEHAYSETNSVSSTRAPGVSLPTRRVQTNGRSLSPMHPGSGRGRAQE